MRAQKVDSARKFWMVLGGEEKISGKLPYGCAKAGKYSDHQNQNNSGTSRNQVVAINRRTKEW